MLPPLDFPTDTTQGSPTTIDRTPRSLENNGLPTKPKRRRKRTGWSSSTGLQRRKRAELQFLREHVRDLEEYAERLKKRVGLITKENGMEGELACNWQEMAAVEYAERKKSEEMNLTLRRIMDHQLQCEWKYKRQRQRGSPLPDIQNVTMAIDSHMNTSDSKPQKPKRKRRSKNPAGYSTRLLHRKKAEMQQLREEAVRLETQVEKLKRTQAVGVGALAVHATQLKKKADFKWMELAMIEFQRRQSAEYTNRKLRALLANQMKVDEALRGIVTQNSVLEVRKNPSKVRVKWHGVNAISLLMQGMSFLYDKPPTSQDPLAAVDNSSVIMAELEKKVSEMYLSSTMLFDEEAEIPKIRCEMQRRYMRKFEETDRVVLARAYRMLLPTDGLQLRANAWTIFSRSKTNPAEASELRSFVELYMEIQPGLSARAEDIAYLRDVAFETWNASVVILETSQRKAAMNFVGIPTEDFDTVSEAITFIDSFDTGLDLDTLNPNRSVQTQDDPPSASNDSDGKRSNVNGVKRKRETNYSTRAQQGRKAEIQALRSRAMELETHVEQLKKLRPRVGGRDYLNLTYEAAQIACRRKTATIEYQELQRSEEINCKLKAIVSQQQKLDATLRRIMGLKAFDQLKGGQPNSYVKNWVKILEGAAESKQVKGIQFLRKYDEPNRVVIVMSGVITLPNDGLHFRDECWMTITRSKTSPNKSVVQGCGQIFLDPRGTNSGSEPERFKGNTAALKSLGFKLREESQLLQNRLIDEADNLVLSANKLQCSNTVDSCHPTAKFKMSFWETTREDKDTVTDAIAFIDSFEANVDETEHNGVSVQESSSSSQTRRKTVSGDLKPKRKKKPNPRREQSNANALSCRVCVRVSDTGGAAGGLSAETMLSNRQELSELAALSQAQWKALVEYERDARRQSEETNRRLKQILAHQLDTNKNLRCTLQKQSLLQVRLPPYSSFCCCCSNSARKKAELQGLRDQVRELEEHAEQLKRLRPNIPTRRVLDPQIAAQQAKWEQIVAAEYEARRKSEETNRKFKMILAHQVEVDKNLRRILHKRSLQVDHGSLGTERGQTLLGLGNGFPSGPPPSTSCSMQMKHIKGLGMTAEALSTTPVPCPMEVAAEICWKDLSIPRPCPEKWVRCINGSQPHSHEKNWILTLQCHSYVKQVKGVQFLRKYTEPNRIVIIKSDVMMLNNEGLHFRDQTWTIISRSQTDPNAAVVRVCEQMYLDREAGEIATARPEDVEYAQNVVLKNLNWKLREHTTHLQDQLIEETQNYEWLSMAV
ncbi:hypothetical protein GQ600_19329 [Phytophthora cactorum]|nr:hypothetical protein GQ600_19329 [Phytophthora cactorum]